MINYKIFINKYSNPIIIGILFISSFILRLCYIKNGLPFLYDIDEPVFVNTALTMVWNNDFNPHWFGHPGATVIDFNAFIYKLISFFGQLIGIFKVADDFKRFYFNDPTLFYLIPRIFFAIFGALTVVSVYFLSKDIYGKNLAVLSALVVAFSDLHNSLSRVIRTDVLATLFMVLIGIFAIKILRKNISKDYIIAGILVSAAVLTKYPAVISIFMVIFAFFWGGGKFSKDKWKLFLFFLSGIILVLIVSPYMFFDYKTVLENVLAENGSDHLGMNGLSFFNNIWTYFNDVLGKTLGIPVLIFSIIGILFSVLKKNMEILILSIFTLIFLLFISSLNKRVDRWVVPMIPFLAIISIYGFRELLNIFSMCLYSRPYKKYFYSLLVLILLTPLIYNSYNYIYFLSVSDSRTVAYNWIVKNLPAGSRLVVEVHGPQLPNNVFNLYDIQWNGDFHADNLKLFPTKNVSGFLNNVPISNIGTADLLNDFDENQIEYVVLSVLKYQYQAESSRYIKNIENYNRLYKKYEVIARFDPAESLLVGPPIEVLKIKRAFSAEIK